VRRSPRVRGYEGYLEKEVLSVDDGVSIFESFMATLDVPTEFQQVDISAELGLA
jgi:hypothetical protein